MWLPVGQRAWHPPDGGQSWAETPAQGDDSCAGDCWEGQERPADKGVSPGLGPGAFLLPCPWWALREGWHRRAVGLPWELSLPGELRGSEAHEPALPTQGGGGEHRQAAVPSTHLEAVKMCLALVHTALMGLSWPLISPRGEKLSTFQTLMTPARQALSSMGRPGTKARAHTQSLCALGICCRGSRRVRAGGGGAKEGEARRGPCRHRAAPGSLLPLEAPGPRSQAWPPMLGTAGTQTRVLWSPHSGSNLRTFAERALQPSDG